MAKAITDFPKAILKIDDPTPETTPGTGVFATQTAVAVVAPTAAPTAPPTPVIEYVQVANAGGQSVSMRSEARQNGKQVVSVGEGAKLQIIGPDVPDSNKAVGVWRHVQLLPPDARSGYILAKYLIPVTGP
jgi:hypothetical protein